MIAIKTIRFLHLLSYLLVTSQVLFYLFILSDALKAISLDSFFEQRKTIDSLMIGRFTGMYYSCLGLSILAVVLSVRDISSLFFISSMLALLFLAVDLFITIKLSIPLNAMAHQYGGKSQDVNWEEIRIQWLNFMKYRGVAMTIGMMILLAALVFDKNRHG
jgi:hypothetical protein